MTYNARPCVDGGSADDCRVGWEAIAATLRRHAAPVLAVETYPGVSSRSMAALARAMGARTVLDTREMFLPADEVERLTRRFVTDDPVFGYMSSLTLQDLLEPAAVARLRAHVETAEEPVLVHGVGASLVSEEAPLVYADMPRWEATQRQRRHENPNLGLDNAGDAPGALYKRAYFVDWRVVDAHKRSLWPRMSYVLDTVDEGSPKLITAQAMLAALEQAARRPFRVVPYFDPAPWGGHWMQRTFGIGEDRPNLGWCFDCVPEENSLLLAFGEHRVEIPSVNLVFTQPRALLGEAVHGRFGAEFPIRTDFLDCVGGGNLSLQVHPLTDYIHQRFGMRYTQDESYYILHAEPGARVHLGVLDGVDREAMVRDLRAAERDGGFAYERYVNRFEAHTHDHFLIPGGTLHGAAAGTMVLEISSTPYIFTFKLYDWDRPGLDGRPRPLHVGHGLANLQWDRDTSYAQRHLINRVEPVAEGDGWREERTGLHEAEFIETRRHWFTKPVPHRGGEGVQVLNLVQGDAAVVESPDGVFDPFEVHYAETFILPAAAGDAVIRPIGGGDQTLATIKAYVRTQP